MTTYEDSPDEDGDGEPDGGEPAGSRSQLAYNIIERMMITGEFPPGALLSEVSLSQAIGIGRTPVREALQRLARDRLVTVVQRKGAVVSGIDVGDYLDSLAMRREIEREIVGVVTRTACREQREALRGLAAMMREAVSEGDIAKAVEIDRRFKVIEFEACENTLLTSSVRPLHALARRVYFFLARKPVPQVALAQAALMEHVARADEAAAFGAHDAFIDAIEKFGLRARKRALPDPVPRLGAAEQDDPISLSARAYRMIEHRIITGHYSENELLTEGRLGQELGLGRTPVREALQKLASHHLVTIMPRRGVLVTDFHDFDLDMLVQARRPLEGLLCRRAAERANPQQRAALGAIVQPWLAAAQRGDNATVMTLDRDMKQLLVAAAGNVYLSDAITPIHTLARAIYFRHQTITNIDVALAQMDVLRAIVARDVEEAGLGALRFIAESVHAIRRSPSYRSPARGG